MSSLVDKFSHLVKVKFLTKGTAWNSVLHGSSILTLVTIFASLANLFYERTVGRLLGPESYGDLSAFVSYLGIFSIPAALITILVIQQLGRTKDNPDSYAFALEAWFWRMLLKNLPLVLLFLAAIIFITYTWSGMPVILSLLVAPGVFLALILAFYNGMLQGLGWLTVFGILSCVSVLVKYIGAFILQLGWGSEVEILAVFILLAGLPWAVIHIKRIKNKLQEKIVDIDLNWIKVFHSRQFWVVTFSALAMNLVFSLSIILAKRYLSSYEAGIYSAWFKLSLIPSYLLSPIVSAFYLTFAKNQPIPRLLHASALLIIFILCSFMYIIYTFWPEFIIEKIYGNQYTSLYLFMGYAGLSGFFIVMTQYFHHYLLARSSWGILTLPLVAIFYVAAHMIYVNNLISAIILELIFMGVIFMLYMFIYVLRVRRDYSVYRI